MRVAGVLPARRRARVGLPGPAGRSPSPIGAPELTPDGYEVAAILTAPLAAFLPGAPIEIVTAERDGYRLRYGGYRVGEPPRVGRDGR